MTSLHPTLKLEAALTTRPTESPSYTDISSRLRAWEADRGRNNELESSRPGHAVFVLDNRDRAFDPRNEVGPHFGNLKRMRRFRLTASWDGQDYPIISVYAKFYPQSYPAFGVDAVTALPCVDGFGPLGRTRITADWPQERSDERIGRILDAASWTTGDAWVLASTVNGLLGETTVLGPAGDRALDEGNSEVQASDLDGAIAVNHLRDVERAESGFFFFGRDGAATFHARHRRLHPSTLVPVATFGNTGDSDELPYHDIAIDDDTPLWNRIEWQRVDGDMQVVEDEASKLDHFPSADRETGLLLTTDGEVLSHAQARLSRHKEAGTRIVSLVLTPAKRPDEMWPLVLGLELGQVVTVKHQPNGGESLITQDSFVESIKHEALPGNWQVTLSLSPADTARYWVLGLPSASELAETTRVAW